MATTCPEIVSADDGDIELSTYIRSVGTVVVVDCRGFGQHVEPTTVQCGTSGQWTPTPSTDCSFKLDESEKVLLGVWIGAGCLFLIGILWILCYCCWCWRKDRDKYHHWKSWKSRERDRESDYTPDNYRESKRYRDTIVRDQSDSPRSTRREVNIYNIRDDSRLKDRYADEYRDTRVYRSTVDKRRDDKSDYSDVRDYRRSRKVDDNASDYRDYRESRRYRRDSDPVYSDFRKSRRENRDDDRDYRESRYLRRSHSDDEGSYRDYRNRHRYDRDHRETRKTYRDDRVYRETRRTDRDDGSDRGIRITRRFDKDPPPYRESEKIRYIEKPVPVFIDRYPPPPFVYDDIIMREKSHRHDDHKRHGLYEKELNATLAPFEVDRDTVYVKYNLGKKPSLGDNIVPSAKIVELDESTTDLVPYNKSLAKSRGRETGVYGSETNYFFGRQDFDMNERDPIVNKGLDHVLYHGNGKSTEIFEIPLFGREQRPPPDYADSAGWKEW